MTIDDELVTTNEWQYWNTKNVLPTNTYASSGLYNLRPQGAYFPLDTYIHASNLPYVYFITMMCTRLESFMIMLIFYNFTTVCCM